MIKAIFFDLDGTLLPMDEQEFTKGYFDLLCKKMIPYGYDSSKLIDTVWAGTKAMYCNDGTLTNEEVFWKTFESIYGTEYLKDKELFEDFYRNEFKLTKNFTKENPLAIPIIEYCKKTVEYVVLSTNPIFPRIATALRMNFIGLKENMFDCVTTYENSNYTKPNPKYFIELLKKFNLKPEEVLLFGNNTYEDGECAYQAGIKCYIVKNNIIRHPKAFHTFEEIQMEDIIPIIEKEIFLNQ